MEQRIRKGGVQTPNGFLFELSGGDVALDFVNTVDLRPASEAKELIPRYDDFLAWSRQSKILNPGQEIALRKLAKADRARAERIRKKAIDARECLFRIVSNLADGGEIPEEVVRKWNRIVSESQSRYEMVPEASGFIWRRRSTPFGLDAPLWPVIHSAVQLLTGPNAARIRKCDGENCNWMFLDTSKRGNRRWCDMTVCGNRAKARSFYERQKKKGSSKQ